MTTKPTPKAEISQKRNDLRRVTPSVDDVVPPKDLDFYMGLDYPVELVRDDGVYVASHPDLPGCVSMGATPNEVFDNLAEVRQLWLEGQLANGSLIPEPSEPESFSGKFVLRIPKLMHRMADRRARQEGVSLNAYVSSVLAGALGYPSSQEMVGQNLFAQPMNFWIPKSQNWAIGGIDSNEKFNRRISAPYLISFAGDFAGHIREHSRTMFNPSEFEDYHRVEEEGCFANK